MSSISDNSANVAWLDEELRKEKAIVTALRDLVDKQQVALTDQNQRLINMEDRLAKLQGQFQRFGELEAGQKHTRDELVLMIGELRQEQQKREAEFLRNRMAEREADGRNIQAIQQELKRFEPLEQSLAVRQAEERRLNEALLRMQQDLDALGKKGGLRDEALRQLGERVEQNTVKLGQAGAALEAGQKATKEAVARVLLAETALAKLGQQVAELQAMRQELTTKQDDLLESTRRSDRERSQALTEWGRKVEGFGHQLDVWAEQLRYFSDQHDKNRRLVREIQELAQQVSQQQDQLRQQQRIAEDQLRHEFREWRSDNDRRWAQDLERREGMLKAQGDLDDGQTVRITGLEEGRQADQAAAAAALERIDALYGELSHRVGLSGQAVLRLVQAEAEGWQAQLASLAKFLGEAE